MISYREEKKKISAGAKKQFSNIHQKLDILFHKSWPGKKGKNVEITTPMGRDLGEMSNVECLIARSARFILYSFWRYSLCC